MFDTLVLWIRKARAKVNNRSAGVGSRGVAEILISDQVYEGRLVSAAITYRHVVTVTSKILTIKYGVYLV